MKNFREGRNSEGHKNIVASVSLANFGSRTKAVANSYGTFWMPELDEVRKSFMRVGVCTLTRRSTFVKQRAAEGLILVMSVSFCKPMRSSIIWSWCEAVMKLQVWMLQCVKLIPPKNNLASKGHSLCISLFEEENKDSETQKPQKRQINKFVSLRSCGCPIP